MSRKPYIGSKISLLSKAQIRYEGILYTIDTVNSTVALAKVKSYGSEGRPTDRPVPPKDDIYEYIIFKGSDIKDISVCEPPPHHGLTHDPAILQSSIGRSPTTYPSQTHYSACMVPSYNQLVASSLLNQQYAASLGLAAGLPGPPVRRGPVVEQAVQTDPVPKVTQKRDQPAFRQQSREFARPPQRWGRDAPRSQRNTFTSNQTSQWGTAQVQGQGTTYDSRPPRRRPGNRRSRNCGRGQLLVENSVNTLQFETDFDFETANAQFNKDDLANELEHKLTIKDPEEKVDSGEETQNSEGTAEEHSPKEKFYYDKTKCFFDNISADLKPRRITWAEEKKLNMETFGVPGRFLRGRGFQGGYRGKRGPSSAYQRPMANVGSGRV